MNSYDRDSASAFRDPDFRLSTEDRQQLDQVFHADAIEEILARYQSNESRTAALTAFLDMATQATRGEITITGMSTTGEDPEVSALVRGLLRQRFRSTS